MRLLRLVIMVLTLGLMVAGGSAQNAMSPGAEPAGFSRGPESFRPGFPWEVDTLLLTGMKLPTDEARCEASPLSCFQLPPRPGSNALGLIFTDGRPARWDSLQATGGGLYWPMERACRALGTSLYWDPELFRGEIRIDSLDCGFVVGGEVIHCGQTALQMGKPVLYLANRLLLPLDFAALVTDSILADRFLYIADSLILVQRAPGPLAPHMRLLQVGKRTYIKWPLSERPAVNLKTDGFCGLAVDLPGVYIDPLNPPVPEPRDGACLWGIRPYLGGTEFLFRVDPSIRAWRLQWRKDPSEVRLTLSANEGDLAYRTYHPWNVPRRAGRRDRRGPVVLVLPEAEPRRKAAGDPSERHAGRFMREIGMRVMNYLEAAGVGVALLEDSDKSGWAPAANARAGEVCLCLRSNLMGDQRLAGCRIVTAPDRPGERPFIALEPVAGQSSGSGGLSRAGKSGAGKSAPGLRHWERVSASHAGRTREFSWLLGRYLEAEFPEVMIRRERWPVASLEGLDLPGAVLYVGDLSAVAGRRGGGLEPLSDRLAAAIAGSIWAFLVRVAPDG